MPFSKEKTLLLMVIRDFVGATPLENLAKTLKADLEKIWASLSKVCKKNKQKESNNQHFFIA